MKGLYFYKLISKYSEDVTKNCKLTVNEIDSNFYTLKEADIISGEYDAETMSLILTRVGGEKIVVDLSGLAEGLTRNLSIDYDSKEGTIIFRYNGNEVIVDGLITEDNIDNNLLSRVYTDSTLIGDGTPSSPLGVNPLERTGFFTPTSGYIDITAGGELPSGATLGERYVVKNYASEGGYLYPFCGVKKMDEDLEGTDWRVPTKSDWDSMLNAIEPCERDKNHTNNFPSELGYLAGKYLKSASIIKNVNGEDTRVWEDSDVLFTGGCDCEEDETCCGKYHPNRKGVEPAGVDKYGMKILGVGYSEYGNEIDFLRKRSGFWTTTPYGSDSESCRIYIKRFDYDTPMVIQEVVSKNALYSVRLVKDYDGSNYHEIETINGIAYKTALVPSETADTGYAIWTTENVSFANSEYMPREVEWSAFGEAYYIYEWDGEKWTIKDLSNGDTVVINTAYKDTATNKVYSSYDEAIANGADPDNIQIVSGVEFRLVDGVIVAVYNEIYDVINAETERANQTEQQLEQEIDDLRVEMDKLDHIITGGTYDNATGELTLLAINSEYDIVINLTGNYGEF